MPEPKMKRHIHEEYNTTYAIYMNITLTRVVSKDNIARRYICIEERMKIHEVNKYILKPEKVAKHT